MKVQKKTIPFLAGITNPVLNSVDGTVAGIEGSGGPLANLIARLWLTAVTVGALAVVLFFVWGTIEWLTAGGKEDNIKKARGKITDAIIGLVLLVASFAIITFLQVVFGFDLLKPVWPTPPTTS